MPKILVVDDNPAILLTVRATLQDAGFEVITTDNPILVPALVRREKADIVLCDVDMPALRGDKVSEILGNKTKVVLFSGRSEIELKTLAKACGAAGYVQKSTDPTHLIDSLRTLLN